MSPEHGEGTEMQKWGVTGTGTAWGMGRGRGEEEEEVEMKNEDFQKKLGIFHFGHYKSALLKSSLSFSVCACYSSPFSFFTSGKFLGNFYLYWFYP